MSLSQMKTIPLGDGTEAIVDDDMFADVSKWKWSCESKYAYRKTIGNKTIYMHKEVCPSPDGFVSDHINRNSRDNRRANLRVVTQSQNSLNQGKHKGKSRFKGVSWRQHVEKWAVTTRWKGKQRWFGYFTDEEEAAHMYDAVVQVLHGHYCPTNHSLGLI